MKFLFFIFILSFLSSADIVGKVLDENSKEPLIGANVYIKDTIFGSATDLEGNYLIKNIPPGNYTIIVSFISYETIEQKFIVSENNNTINFQLGINSLKTNEINVSGVLKKSNEVKKILDQKESKNIINTFSANELRKSGDSNAAEALRRITGVTIIEDKNVVIRGLGDRYSQARINGLTMPSTDPDKRNLPLNLFPSKIIEKIDVYKSYHPKLPGNFAGGSIDVKTKSYPDNFILNFNLTNSTNSNLIVNNIELPNDGYINIYGDYSNFKLDLSHNEFGSEYIFEYRPLFFSQYHGTDIEDENLIFNTFLYDSEFDNYGEIQNSDWNINDQVWEDFYYNKLAQNANELKSSYKRSSIKNQNLKFMGIELPKSPIGFSLMNGNKFKNINKLEYGYFVNLNYKNDYNTNMENNKIYSKSSDNYQIQYDFDQSKNSFKTNLSALVTTGLLYNVNKNHFIKFDYNYLDILTSKNESMSTISEDTFYELDNGGVSLSDKITEKSINSNHYILSHSIEINDFRSNLNIFYNKSKSELNMPDMKQQTYHKNIYMPNGVWDDAEEFIDYNGNGIWDDMDQFIDLGNGFWDEGEEFIDLGNGIYDQENIGEDFNDNGIPAFGWSGANNGIWDFEDSNGNGICDKIVGLNPLLPNVEYWECETWTDIGNGVWDENEVFFDIGNGVWDENEVLIADFDNDGIWDEAEEFIDSNGDGIFNQAEQFDDENNNGIWDEGEELISERIDYLNENYRYLSLIQGQGENGVKPTKRTWVYGGENQNLFGIDYSISYEFSKKIGFNLLLGYESLEKNRSFSKREFTMGSNSSFTVFDGLFNPNINYAGEIFDDADNLFSLQLETFTDINGNGLWDSEEFFTDLNNNGIWDGPEFFTDLNNNGIWDGPDILVTDFGNGIWDQGEVFIDENGDGQYNPSDEFNDANDNGVWDGDYFFDINGNGEYDADDFLESFSFLGDCDYDGDGESDGPCDVNGDGVYNPLEELITDWDNDGQWDDAESFIDLGNGVWDEGEEFNDINNNGIWDLAGEPVIDINNNGIWDDAEPFDDINNNGIWDEGEEFNDIQDPNLVNGVYDEGETFDDINNNGIWDEGENFSDGYNGICDCLIKKDGIYMMESSALASNNSYRAEEKLISQYVLFNSTYKELPFIGDFNLGIGFRYEDYQLNMQPYNTITGENLWRMVSKNNIWDPTESFEDANMNNQYDPGEKFVDLNSDGAFNFGETYEDLNNNGIWDESEPLEDMHPILLINANKKEKAFLPVVNFSISPNKLIKLRFSYSRTLARPNYRELAPTKYEEFYSDRAVEGNPYLKTTDINNFDLRFELYPSLTSMYSIALYKKTFDNPIALVIRPGSSHNYISYSNSKSADVNGFEIEVMRKLEFIPSFLGNFNLGSNFSFIKSESKSYDQFISYMGVELADISKNKDRPMIGQSDFIYNGNIGWNWKNKYELNFTYNYFSKRLIYVGAGESPDEYEYPQPDLNLTTKVNFKDISFSFKIKNLLDSEYKLGAEYNDSVYYTKQYKPGISYSLSVGYDI